MLPSWPDMTLLAIGAAAAPPTIWALRHNRSPAVAAWEPSRLPGGMHGDLFARVAGDGDPAIVLLHGLVSSGDVFGTAFDDLTHGHRLLVPDLLGFGRSMDEARDTFSPEAHLDALDDLAHRTGLFDRRWVLGAHSMGSALALRWATRHRDRVDRVVCWGAPIYPSADAARSQISGSAMTRLFVLDTRWAQWACKISCRHRAASGWLTAVAEPRLPVPVARAVSQHTWPAYRDAMRDLVIDTDWRALLRQLDDNGTRIELVWGANDKVGDPGHAATIIGPTQTVTSVAGADHHLPMSHPEICRAHLLPPR